MGKGSNLKLPVRKQGNLNEENELAGWTKDLHMNRQRYTAKA